MKLSLAKNLIALRIEAKRRVDEAAVTIRHTRASYGVDAIYAEKTREAEQYKAAAIAGSPDLADYPFLSAETKRLGQNPMDVAALWIERQRELRTFLAKVEVARLNAKAAIDTATTPGEIEHLAAYVSWPD
ncbi:hypothetical protein F1188_16375 [Roseospira marina]|uniref:Uncharacterized protein n=1 Tax=Roseospira marina TaxID=140057 RepID=A0A5M6I8C1_9PROT|nr:hypothetical protein [Roseospira marina]KAA5604433.1 hypothetical protein F1188_16375 [Roseospira marina]MBB4315369.1 hypothetical protein [Roseospira marina]MBB5088486.1 hypothetical protein [Roseospira marina]